MDSINPSMKNALAKRFLSLSAPVCDEVHEAVITGNQSNSLLDKKIVFESGILRALGPQSREYVFQIKENSAREWKKISRELSKKPGVTTYQMNMLLCIALDSIDGECSE